MSEDKTFPTHRLSFSEKHVDDQGREKLGAPVEVATAWPRKNGKQGSIIDWHIKPEKLGDGAFFLLENERQQHQDQHQDRGDAFDPHESKAEQGQKLER